jgi:uncharacterized small protein (DUF1192 family)
MVRIDYHQPNAMTQTTNESESEGRSVPATSREEKLERLAIELRECDQDYYDTHGEHLANAFNFGVKIEEAKKLLKRGEIGPWMEGLKLKIKPNWISVIVRAAKAGQQLMAADYSWNDICAKTNSVRELAALYDKAELDDPWKKPERKKKPSAVAAAVQLANEEEARQKEWQALEQKVRDYEFEIDTLKQQLAERDKPAPVAPVEAEAPKPQAAPAEATAAPVARITELEAENAALRKEVAALKAKLATKGAAKTKTAPAPKATKPKTDDAAKPATKQPEQAQTAKPETDPTDGAIIERDPETGRMIKRTTTGGWVTFYPGNGKTKNFGPHEKEKMTKYLAAQKLPE